MYKSCSLMVARFLTLAMTALALQALPTDSAADEVGKDLFVVDPTSQPAYVSPSGTRYWSCNGMVSKKLLGIIKADLAAISKVYGVSQPSDYCLYNIGNVELMGRNITLYSVDYYISKSDMNSCLFDDRCLNTRKMTFKINNGKLLRQYMVADYNQKLLEMVCMNMQGQIVKGC